jgi:signal peptidase I
MFIYFACLLLLIAPTVSLYQYFVLKVSKKPIWIYRIHYTALFAFAYIIIQLYNAAVFLTVATILMLLVKAFDHFRPKDREISLLTETSRDIWLFLLIFWLIRTFVYDYSPVPSGSMEPTLYAGDLIAINKMAYQIKIPPLSQPLYRFAKPKRGDVVVFNSPLNLNEYWIKRVIAVSGDTVEYINKQYYINGKLYEQSKHDLNYLKQTWQIQATENIDGHEHTIQLDNRRFNQPLVTTVPEDSYFVSGDNRDGSYDSRAIGPIPESCIVGKATHIITQFTQSSILTFKRSGRIQ